MTTPRARIPHPSSRIPLSALCIVLFALCIAAPVGAASRVVLVRDGAPVAKIYVAADDPAPAEWVATNAPPRNETREATLRRYLSAALFDLSDVIRRSSGAALETVAVASPDEIRGPAIVAGSLAATCGVRPAETNLVGETFVLKTVGDRLYLAGDGPVGQTYAIYAFLNEMGVEWVMPDALGEVIPARGTWEIAIDREEAPSFIVRNPWLSGGSRATRRENAERTKWQIRNREQTRTMVQGIYANEGGVGRGFAGKQWDAWFEEHPECLAVQVAADGTRKTTRYKLNTEAPATADLYVEAVARLFEKNGWPSNEHHVISFSPSDGGGWDMSESSMGVVAGRRDPISGDWDRTDLVFGFFGRVLAKLTNDFPNVEVRSLIYNDYEDFPAGAPPPLQYFYADINQSRYHGACDAAVSPSRAYYRQVVEKWAKSGAFLTFYHYNWNLAEATLPYTRLRIVGEDMPWEHAIGAKGFEDEHLQGLSFSAPHDWLQAKMGWNVALDWLEETKRFCRLAYGDGAETMFDYWMTIVEKQRTQGEEAGSFQSHGRVWSEDEAKALLALCDRAEAEAKAPAEKARVRVAAYCARQLVHFTAFTAAYSRYDFAAAQARIDDMLATFDAANTGEYPQTVGRWGLPFIKGLRRFADEALKYAAPSTNGAWRIVARVPDRLKVQVNPQFNGELLNLQSPLLDDRLFPEVPTWSSTVSATGLSTLRSGELWFRARIPTPRADLGEGEGIGLFLGGFDRQATVYVNGTKVGSASGFAKPAVFDLTGRLAPEGGDNLVAICIARRGNAEAMTGGLLYPSFLFAGPRVPPAADADDAFKIVLPGMGQ